jgi:hypothetical protein
MINYFPKTFFKSKIFGFLSILTLIFSLISQVSVNSQTNPNFENRATNGGIQTKFLEEENASKKDSIKPFSGEISQPETIRVAITGEIECSAWLDKNRPILEIKTISFRSYVKGVLPNEWPSLWPSESLKAGAMAIKMYTMYTIQSQKWANKGFDVVDNTCDQVYRPRINVPTTDAAVDSIWGYYFLRNNRLLGIHYLNTDANCGIYFPSSPCMGQWGSKDLADKGKNWEEILKNYYSPIQIVPLEYAGVNFIPKSYFAWNDTTNGNRTWTLISNPSDKSIKVRLQVSNKADRYYTVGAKSIITPSIDNVLGGPVIVSTENGQKVITSQRVSYKEGIPQGTSFNEIPGIDADKLTNTYYFAWNDTTNGNRAWTLVANPENALNSVNVSIKIAGETKANKSLAPGEVWTPMFNNILAGPVEVSASGNVIATQRVMMSYGNKVSFNEFAGIPYKELSNRYYFSWNDTTNQNEVWTLVANQNQTTNQVRIKIGGNEVANKTLQPKEIWTPKINNLIKGPVEVIATKPVIATQRTVYNNTFNEFAGISGENLTKKYYFTWNDTSGNNDARTLVSNVVGGGTAEVEIKIAGETKANKSLAPGEVWTPMFNNILAGPVEVISKNKPVLTTQRVFLEGSFSEIAGIPNLNNSLDKNNQNVPN